MKAIVFAAGLGTRLKPLTDSRPKALVEVNGEAMLARVMKKLKSAGVRDCVVNVHHFADMVERFISENDGFGMNVNISDERRLLLDTGGGILKARAFLDDGSGEPVIAHNADILTDFPIAEMVNDHETNRADATLMTASRDSSRQIYFSTADGRLQGWQNLKTGQTKPQGFNPDASGLLAQAFGGVQIFSPSIFPVLEDYSKKHGEVFSIIPFYLDNIASLNIQHFTPLLPFRWFDIGSPEKLLAAETAFSAM